MPDGLKATLCVDALSKHLTGIGRYTWELAQRLPEHPKIKSLQYFAENRVIGDPVRLVQGQPIYRGRGLRRYARSLKALRALRSTIVHGPNYFLPRRAHQGIITVHDLSVLRFPETHPLARVKHFER